MDDFVYGSDVINNEVAVSMRNHVRNFGNILRSVVRFFAMLLCVVLFNMVLKMVMQQHAEFSFNTLRVIDEGLYILINESSLSILTFTYNHLFATLLVMLGGVTLCTLCVYARDLFCIRGIRTRSGSMRNAGDLGIRSCLCAVSYRQKVSFLS